MTKIEFKNLPDTSTPLSAENLNTMQDNIENAIDNVSIDLDTEVSTTSTNGIENQAITNYVNKSVSGDLVVDSIRTKNMFDINSIVAGDITGNSPTIRLSSRQPIWLEAGTYTFSCNLTSPLRWSLNVQNVATPPLSNYATYIYDSGWLAYSTTSHTFTISIAGWFCLMLSKENNATLTPEEVKGFNYQLEVGDTATTYKPYQNLNNEDNLYMDNEVLVGNFLGKPLYRKVFNITNPSSSNIDYVSVADLNISKLVHLYGFYKNSTGTFGIPFHDSDTNYSVLFVSSGNYIRGRFGTPNNITEVKVILEYTKTTD